MMSLLVVVMIVVPWLASKDAEDRDGPLGPEARAWLALAAVQMIIWSTLGPAQTLAAALRARGVLVTTSIVLTSVALGGAIAIWARRRPGPLEVAAGIGVLAAYLMVLVRIEAPEERTHLFEYGIIAVLALQALRLRSRAGGRVAHPWPAALVLAMGLGWIDEAIQGWLPGRVYDLRDVLFNALAALMALTSVAVLGYARSRGRLSR